MVGKNRITRRSFLYASAVATGGALLAACAPAAAPGAAPAGGEAAAPAAQPVELRMWMFSLTDPLMIDVMEDIAVPDFQAVHPEFKLAVEFVPYEGYREKIATNLAGGTLPDMHEAGTQEAGRVATSGMGIPLDDFMATWDDFDDYFAPGIEGTRYSGYTWGVPFRTEPSCLLYWKSAYEAAGLDPAAPPATDREYLETSLQMQIVDGGRTIQQGGYTYSDWRGMFQEFEVGVQRRGGEITDEAYQEVRFGGPEGEETIAYLVEAALAMYPPDLARLPEGSPIPHFAQKAIAQHYRGHTTDANNVLKFNPDAWDDLGMAVPLVAEGYDTPVSIMWRNFYVISPTSEDRELAVEFIHQVTNTKVNGEYCRIGGYAPVRKSALELDWVKESPYMSFYLENASQYGYKVINPPQYFELRQTGGAFFEEAALGKISASEALAQVVAVWEEGLKTTPPVQAL